MPAFEYAAKQNVIIEAPVDFLLELSKADMDVVACNDKTKSFKGASKTVFLKHVQSIPCYRSMKIRRPS